MLVGDFKVTYKNNAHKFRKQLGKIITLEHCVYIKVT